MKKELYEEYFMALSELIVLLATGSVGLFTVVTIIAFLLKGQWEVIFLSVAIYIFYKTFINSLCWLNARVGKIKWLKKNMEGSGEVNEQR